MSFGTSGHRGSSLGGSFNEDHLLAIVQAICLHRKQAGIGGPLFLGKDTHALSEPAQTTALEVLAANGMETMVARDGAFTPTPAVSRAILAWNRGRTADLADGIVITPSHNPPDNGGIKYAANQPFRQRIRDTNTKQQMRLFTVVNDIEHFLAQRKHAIRIAEHQFT